MTFGTNPQNFTMGTATTINLGPSLTMNGTLDFAGGGIRLNNVILISLLLCLNSGSMNDDCTGANTFMQAIGITNIGPGYLSFALTQCRCL
ncbi:MAG: hypothetical protein IPK10_04145 [Bacteroidetes bacterium]|nr:hypothetical protein [Bacteroidota bacterium]